MKINEIIVEQRVDELGWQDIKQGAAKVGQAAATGLGTVARGAGALAGGAVGAAQGAWDASKQGFAAGQQTARTAVAGTQQPQAAAQPTVAVPPGTTKANPPKTATAPATSTTNTPAGQTPNMQGQVQQRQEPSMGGVQQAPGFKPGAAVPPGAGGQTNSLANAIRAGAAGGQVGVQKPADAYYERAPIGTTVNATNGQWKKGYEGWVNTQTNTRATAQQAKLLDQYWYKTTQKQIKAQGARQAQPQQATQTTVTPPPPPVRPRTGGKVAGQVSQTPSAVKQRQARQAKKTPAQPAAKPAPTATPTTPKVPFKPTVVPK